MKREPFVILSRKIFSYQLTALFKRLYEDNVLGKILNEVFRKLSDDYLLEQKEIQSFLPKREERLEKLKDSVANVSAFLEKAKQYTKLDTLTAERGTPVQCRRPLIFNTVTSVCWITLRRQTLPQSKRLRHRKSHKRQPADSDSPLSADACPAINHIPNVSLWECG